MISWTRCRPKGESDLALTAVRYYGGGTGCRNFACVKQQDETLYVSAGKTGGVVSRFGLQSVFIGAKRDKDSPNRIVFDHEEVVAIPPVEAQKYSREYRKAIASKDLVVRSKEDFEKWSAAEKQRQDAELAEAKRKADEEAKVAAGEKPTAAKSTAAPLVMKDAPATKRASDKDAG